MLRLSSETGSSGSVLRVEGRLQRSDLEEMERAVQAARPHALDLSGLLSADAESVAFLRSLRDRGCRLLHASLYIAGLLEETRS